MSQPFAGTGAESKWWLDMPSDTKGPILECLSDVVVHLRHVLQWVRPIWPGVCVKRLPGKDCAVRWIADVGAPFLEAGQGAWHRKKGTVHVCYKLPILLSDQAGASAK
jgi:hypothetical protein